MLPKGFGGSRNCSKMPGERILWTIRETNVTSVYFFGRVSKNETTRQYSKITNMN